MQDNIETSASAEEVEMTQEETVDTVQEETQEEPQKELTPEEQAYQDLQTKRMGTFKVQLDPSSAIYLRNILDKSEYEGPQQAYLLVVAKSEMSSIVNALKDNDKTKRYEVDMTSACIESLGFFMNRLKGKGSDSAMKLFTASMLLRPAMGQINELDQKLAEARKNLEQSDK